MAGPLSSSNNPFAAPSYMEAFRESAALNPNKIDEGYSEETRSQTESDAIMRTDERMGDSAMDQDAEYPLPDWVLNMNEAERGEFAYAILRSLRTSTVAGIVEKLNPLLHRDPVLYLPPEITFHIFSYLTPQTLLRISTLSKAWRSRVLDSPLWRLLFRLEGWNSNFAHVRAFEESEKAKLAASKPRRTRPRGAEEMEIQKPSIKKRARERPLFGGRAPSDTAISDGMEPLSLEGSRDSLASWGEQHGAVEADESLAPALDDTMEDISYQNASGAATPNSDMARRNRNASEYNEELSWSPLQEGSMYPPVRPSLLLPSSTEPRVNWQYLYKQKRRLEENWDNGRFKNFQLPHPNHMSERHTECVYTIQYSGKWLVSGARDKTVRIWDLDTQRLAHPPLTDHTASVLCLQFDERPQEDILITAGSDCRVILWRFSTGKLIKKIEDAHSESILNLRFDDRYLVTCSKDKTIKVWNRREMLPTDDAYPSCTTKSKAHFPSYIINMQHEIEDSYLHYKPLEPYTLLMTMEGHGAAVNAIQIYNGQIVSASGDRNVKVWDVRTGACLRTFSGHTKGIACVQFDGRRIVSGSSDETVRIFDRATGAEVACLQGHTNLVRTVQAQFGDLPGSEEELEAEAKAVDRKFFEAQRRGLISKELTREQRRARNAGSRDPRSLFAYGAKLPPGGGGSKWARIVSGSYDETIIIWKKGHDGAWEKSRVLYQNEAAIAAGGGRRQRRQHGNAAPQPQQQQQQQQQPQQQGAQQGGQQPAQPNFQALAQQAQAQAQAAQTLAQQASALVAYSQAVQGQVAQTQQQLNANAPPPAMQNAAAPPTNQQPMPPAVGAGAVPNPPPAAGAANTAAHHHHHHHHHAHHVNAPTSSRVFKLQFDARRIICCSQDPTIVGWDFANGDKDLIQASQFFSESG